MASILSKINQAVGDSFEALCAEIDKTCPLEPKIKELIRLACVVTDRSEFGIKLHAYEAIKLGASREELLGTVLNCLPVTGIESVASALVKVLATLETLDAGPAGD
ncbi:MAG: carboxymuconolactone decarboxylase family protein [Acidobacteria bacterium]|jgi:alkylhydroperoxidase/carboxymuconolactone decarboxylase family protein YurZ|nr:carboxymuconolactone decarboxylase family protein [Acidobacteriota bacterium]